MNNKAFALAGSLTALLMPGIAAAHPGHEAGASLAAGMVHPLAGLDHLCALLAVGLLAGRMGGRAGTSIALTFLALMSCGIIGGIAGVELPLVEVAIGTSIIGLALLAWRPPRRLPFATAAFAGSFAVFHGHAHGVEAAAGTTHLSYAAGLLVSSAGVIVAATLLARAPAWSRTRLQHRHS